LWSKNLDQGRFPWLAAAEDKKLEIVAEDLELILDGVDVFKRHKRLDFKSVS
jgi:hypothetical protein